MIPKRSKDNDKSKLGAGFGRYGSAIATGVRIGLHTLPDIAGPSTAIVTAVGGKRAIAEAKVGRRFN